MLRRAFRARNAVSLAGPTFGPELSKAAHLEAGCREVPSQPVAVLGLNLKAHKPILPANCRQNGLFKGEGRAAVSARPTDGGLLAANGASNLRDPRFLLVILTSYFGTCTS
jgi:hypothetical protein